MAPPVHGSLVWKEGRLVPLRTHPHPANPAGALWVRKPDAATQFLNGVERLDAQVFLEGGGGGGGGDRLRAAPGQEHRAAGQRRRWRDRAGRWGWRRRGAGFSLPPAAGTPGAPVGGAGGAGPGTGIAPGDAVCAATRAEAAPVPADLYVMQDRSDSMNVDGKWDAVRAAITSFVRLPAARGISVGVGFFPRSPGPVPLECQRCNSTDCLANCGCLEINCTPTFCLCTQFSSSSCFASDYTAPVVPIAELPAASVPIVFALDSVRPSGGTPTLPALRGALDYARGWTASNKRRVAIALATDGDPANCGEGNSIESVSALARSAAAEGLPVFVIGVGPLRDNLNAIAAAGGTTKAFLVDGVDVEEKFLAALQSIQGLAARLSCSYAIPAPPTGQLLDPLKVNVEFTTGSPAQTTTIGQVSDKARCDARGGWYYDNPAAPTQIQLCESSCNAVNVASYNKVAVTFGCRTNAID